MHGEYAERRDLDVEVLAELDGGELGGRVRRHAGVRERCAQGNQVDECRGAVFVGGRQVVREEVGSFYVDFLRAMVSGGAGVAEAMDGVGGNGRWGLT